MKIISITNLKGGVAKTTTTATLATALSLQGYKTLVIDMDPQSNLSAWISSISHEQKTIGDVLTGAAEIDEAIICTSKDEPDLLPSNLDLAVIESSLTYAGREYNLREAIERWRKEKGDIYDYIIIDTPPSISTLTTNALTASDYFIIPSEATEFSVSDGVTQIMSFLGSIKKYYNPKLADLGILITRFDGRTNNAKAYSELLKQSVEWTGLHVFNTKIREGVKIKEAQSEHKSIFAHCESSSPAKDYLQLTKEVLSRIDSDGGIK